MAGYGRRKGNGVGKGPAGGDGWGGPPKGAGSKKKLADVKPGFTPETAVIARTSQMIGEDRVGKSHAEVKRDRSIALEDMLYGLASAAEREETRVSAATKLHAIYNGTPIARNININSDDISNLSDDELRAELERTGGTAFETGAGTAAPGVPKKSPGILH